MAQKEIWMSESRRMNFKMNKMLVHVREIRQSQDRGGHEDHANICEVLRGRKVILETHSAVITEE